MEFQALFQNHTAAVKQNCILGTVRLFEHTWIHPAGSSRLLSLAFLFAFFFNGSWKPRGDLKCSLGSRSSGVPLQPQTTWTQSGKEQSNRRETTFDRSRLHSSMEPKSYFWQHNWKHFRFTKKKIHNGFFYELFSCEDKKNLDLCFWATGKWEMLPVGIEKIKSHNKRSCYVNEMIVVKTKVTPCGT